MNFIIKLKKARNIVEKTGELYVSRRRAKSKLNKLVNKKGHKIVAKKELKEIKHYAKLTFGSSSYWPWLALYTEIRGEFKPGWIPEDYYTVLLKKKYNPKSAKISKHKTFDHRMFPEFSVEPLLVKIWGSYYNAAAKKVDKSEAERILQNYKEEIVIKQEDASGGGKIVFANADNVDLNQLMPSLNYVIQPVLRQHENLNRLNKSSVNTIRVFTYLKSNGEAEVKFSTLRFGIGNSRVDNVNAGGGFVNVNENGELSEFGYDKIGICIGKRHPDTGVKFSSISIPSAMEILTKCKFSHEKFPYLRFIGWDVMVSESGKPRLLEWNSSPTLWIPEALFGPLFREDDFDFV